MNSEPPLKQLERQFDMDLPKTEQLEAFMNDLLNYVVRSTSKMRRCLNRYKDLISQNKDDKDDTMINHYICLLYTSPSPRDRTRSRMPSSA